MPGYKRRRSFLIYITCIFLALHNNALNNCALAQVTKPAITISDPVFDFGHVNEGAKVQHDFTIVNKGNADLLIQKVVAGCGCTAAAVVNQAIAANAETKVNVSLDTSGMGGRQSKTVRVYSNDPENPITILTLNGEVGQRVTVEPANIIFESLTRGQESAGRTVTISSGGTAKIGEIESFSNYIKLSDVSGDDLQKKFTVNLDPNLPLGDFRDRIIVKLSGGGKSSINIPVYANVKGLLQLNPPALSFGIMSGTDVISRKVVLENMSDIPYILKSVESADKALSAKVIENKPGKTYTVEVFLDPKKAETDMRAELKFIAETKIEESLSINAYGVLPPKL